MPMVTGSDNLQEAVKEISREISSEFSCAKDNTDPGSGLSPLFSQIYFTFGDLLIWVNPFFCLLALGVEIEWSSDVRKRIQESSYIQEQYVLTHCSLSSEQSLQTHSHSHIQASSNSDSAGGVFLPDPHSSGSAMDTGSLPQGLEKLPPPEQRSSLSRWADAVWSQNLSGETDSSVEKVRDGPRNQDFLMSQITAFQGVQTQNLIKVSFFLTTRVSFWIEVRRLKGDINRWSVQPWQHEASRPPRESWRCTV